MAKETKKPRASAEQTAKKPEPKAAKQKTKKRHARTYGELVARQQDKTAAGAQRSSYQPYRSKVNGVKVKRPGVDPIFLILLCMLLGFGLLMLFSASYANAMYYEGDSFYYIKRQAIFILIGFAGMYVASRIDYTNYKKLHLSKEKLQKPFWQKFAISMPYVMYGVTLVLLAVTLVMRPHNNAHRWINIGSFSFQPSDIMKFCLVVLFAAYIDKHYRDIAAHSFKYGVLYYVAFLVPVAGIMLLQPHVSGTIIMMLITAVMMLMGGTKLRYFAGLAGCGFAGIAGIVIIKGVGYVQERLVGWLDPMSDISDSTWQTLQGLVCIATGGFWGKGFGNSYQKYLFLPEPQNDFVFAIVCEELGLFGAFLVIALFGLLIWRGYSIASKAKDRFGFLLGVGIISQIAIQVLLNIAVVTKTIPNTGVSLPFFSYGGTSLCILMTEMGIILNISRHVNAMKAK